MYVRTISRKNKSGSTTTYVQLAHNICDPKTGNPRTDVLYTFGRVDALDVDAIKRLTKSLSRFLSPEEALKIDGDTPLRFIRSYPLGGAHLLCSLWEQLGIPEALSQCVKDRSFTSPVKWAAFAMRANRALAPDSKGGGEWVREDVALGNPEPIELQHLYWAMDVLLKYREVIHKEVYFAVADLLNLEVDLFFFDTTSTYFHSSWLNQLIFPPFSVAVLSRTGLPDPEDDPGSETSLSLEQLNIFKLLKIPPPQRIRNINMTPKICRQTPKNQA